MKKNTIDNFIRQHYPASAKDGLVKGVISANGYIHESNAEKTVFSAIAILKKEATNYLEIAKERNLGIEKIKKFLSPTLELYPLPMDFICVVNNIELQLNFLMDKNQCWYLKITEKKSGTVEYEKMDPNELERYALLVDKEKKNWLYSLCFPINSANNYSSNIGREDLTDLWNKGFKVNLNVDSYSSKKTIPKDFYDRRNPFTINIINKNVQSLFLTTKW